MRALTTAIARSASLGRLNLLKTVPFTAASGRSMHELVASASALTRLSAISIGGRGYLRSADHATNLPLAPHRLLHRLGSLPLLRELVFQFYSYILPEYIPEAARALVELTQLRSLQYMVPPLNATVRDSDDTSESEEYEDYLAPLSALSSAAATLTALTAIDISFYEASHRTFRQPWLLSVATLTGLRSLRLSPATRSDVDDATLAQGLTGLTRLNSLHLDGWCLASVAAACSLPARLHLQAPASTSTSDTTRQALLGATQLASLTLDLCIDPPEEPVDLARWLPLVQAATSVSINFIGRGGGGSGGDELVRPVLRELAAHSTLQQFGVFPMDPLCPETVEDELQAVSGISSLQEVTVTSDAGLNGDPGAMVVLRGTASAV
eukprot:jgi/Ulvmu1/12420/UM009_0070.1